MSLGGKGGLKEGTPNLEEVKTTGRTNEKLANLKQNTDMPDLVHRSNDGRTNEILAKKSGIGKSSMAYLIAVYRDRPDLFELVFDGKVTR